jgi:hypothetical protein
MTDLIAKTVNRLGTRLAGWVWAPGDDRCAPKTAIWSKWVGRVPRAGVSR